jgi:hypothetical protein
MKLKFLVLMTFTILTFSRCKEISEKTDPVSNAKHMLNKGQYEEAISLLSEEVGKEKVSSETRVVLASAFAGSVGLNIIESFGAFQELFFKTPLLSAKKKSASLVEGGNERLSLDQVHSPTESVVREEVISDRVKAEQEVLSLLTSMVTGSKVIMGLKWIPPEKRVRILKAVQQIDFIPKDDPQYRSASIYRLIIYANLFMSTFRDSLSNPNLQIESPSQFYCQLDIARLAERTTKLRVQISTMELITQEINPDVIAGNSGLKKLTETISRLQRFFSSNRSPAIRSYFSNGVLRNEICK